MKYRAIFRGECDEIVLGDFNDRNDAINEALTSDKISRNYCLDDKQMRKKCLEDRGFCICGCGPDMLVIEEIN